MKKRVLKTLLVVFAILTAVFVFLTAFFALTGGAVRCINHLYHNSDNYYSKMLVEAIREENIDAIQQIIEEKPTCINAYPSILPRWWHAIGEVWMLYPFNEACLTFNPEIIELLIENGADVNCNDGLTPLSIVYRYKCDGWYEISQVLIENGALLDYTTEYSRRKSTVFQDIVYADYMNPPNPKDDEKVLKAFNNALENCDHSNVDWGTVLQHSISNDRLEITKILLDGEYCNINDTISGDMTPLMFAARDSTPEMVQLLLDYGADKTITDEDGKTAYDYAVESSDDTAVIDLLKP